MVPRRWYPCSTCSCKPTCNIGQHGQHGAHGTVFAASVTRSPPSRSGTGPARKRLVRGVCDCACCVGVVRPCCICDPVAPSRSGTGPARKRLVRGVCDCVCVCVVLVWSVLTASESATRLLYRAPGTGPARKRLVRGVCDCVYVRLRCRSQSQSLPCAAHVNESRLQPSLACGALAAHRVFSEKMCGD